MNMILPFQVKLHMKEYRINMYYIKEVKKIMHQRRFSPLHCIFVDIGVRTLVINKQRFTRNASQSRHIYCSLFSIFAFVFCFFSSVFTSFILCTIIKSIYIKHLINLKARTVLQVIKHHLCLIIHL
jgi:hypothetical protein